MAVQLKSSAGTAVKFFGKSWGANAFTYALLLGLSYGVFISDGLLKKLPQNDTVKAIERVEESIEKNDTVQALEETIEKNLPRR